MNAWHDIIIYTIAVMLVLFSVSRFLPGNQAMTPEETGKEWEDWCAKYIRMLTGGRVYRSLLIKRGNGDTAEIDLAVMTRKGLLCIECKSRKGHVTGVLCEDEWTVLLHGTAHSFRNPVRQNAYHIMALKDMFENYGVCNIIFKNLVYIDCDALNYSGDNAPNTLVTDWYGTIKKWYNDLPDIYDQALIERANELLSRAQADPAAIQKHTMNLKTKYDM